MIRLTAPFFDEREFCEVKKVMESGFLVQGDKVKEFEEKIAGYVNIKHAIAVSSGTAALHLVLLALKIKPGDEVIVPDYTFPATVNAVEILGAKPRFVDINLDDFCINPQKIENIINKKTKAIIPVHEFGQSANMKDIAYLADKYNLKIIEDAACALGAEFKGQQVGTFGKAGCFSLHPRKSITTGEGGIIVTNSDSLAENLKILRNHGIKTTKSKNKFVCAGLNYRMTEIQGAIGIIQATKINEINKKRIELADQYKKLLKNVKEIKLPIEKKSRKHIWQSFHILLLTKAIRDELLKKLKENDIESNYGAYAVSQEPYYFKKYKHEISNIKNSIIAHNTGLALPLHPGLQQKDLEKISYCIKDFFN